MEPTAPAIEVVGLAKRYGERRAVDGISLSVGVGEVFGLLGPNGAGKTTTVEILEGYREADAGSVRVLGLDPWKDAKALHPRIGVMLQEGGLYPGVKPLEALELFASYYDDPDDPERLLQLVGLDDARKTLVRRLSGGQCQRLSLALALVGRPRVVFLDEPTAGMDPRARATTWQLVRNLRDDGVTIVLTTHAMDEAEHLCDRVAIVDHGRIVAAGSPTELTERAGDEEVSFSTAAGLDRRALAKALGLAADAVREIRPGEYVVATASTPTLLADLTAWLRDEELSLGDLRAGRRSLEEVFLRMTSEDRPTTESAR
ncbi:MAG: ABC transporter ATP-binding protein [Acidimicrobiia bacterium]